MYSHETREDVRTSPHYVHQHTYDSLHGLTKNWNWCRTDPQSGFWTDFGETRYAYDELDTKFKHIRESFENRKKYSPEILCGWGIGQHVFVFAVNSNSAKIKNRLFIIFRTGADELNFNIGQLLV